MILEDPIICQDLDHHQGQDHLHYQLDQDHHQARDNCCPEVEVLEVATLLKVSVQEEALGRCQDVDEEFVR